MIKEIERNKYRWMSMEGRNKIKERSLKKYCKLKAKYKK